MSRRVGGPRDHSVGVVHVHHHRAEVGDVLDRFERLLVGNALLGAEAGKLGCVLVQQLGVVHGDDSCAAQVEAEIRRARIDLLLLAQNHDVCDFAFEAFGCGVEDAIVLGFGKDDALSVRARFLDEGECEAQGRDDVGAFGDGFQENVCSLGRERGVGRVRDENHWRVFVVAQGLPNFVGGAHHDRGGDGRVLFCDFRGGERRDRCYLFARALVARNEHDERAAEVGGRPARAVKRAGKDRVSLEEAHDEDRVEVPGVVAVTPEDRVHRVFFVDDVACARRPPGSLGVLTPPDGLKEAEESGVLFNGAVCEGSEHSDPVVNRTQRLEVLLCCLLGGTIGFRSCKVDGVCHDAIPSVPAVCWPVSFAVTIVPHRQSAPPPEPDIGS